MTVPPTKGGGRSERAWRGVGTSAESNPSPRSDVPPAKDGGNELARLSEVIARYDDPEDKLNIALGNFNRVVAERDALREELAATKKYAAEGWAWLDDALNALGAKTVFDIPKAERPE